MLINRYGKCPVPGCEEAATEGHHILYDYHQHGPVIKDLCPEHHRWITRRQSHAARKKRRSLSEKQRWFFWYELTGGRMRRPRSTALDKEWAEQSTITTGYAPARSALQFFNRLFNQPEEQQPEEERQGEIQQEEIQPEARRKAVRKAKKAPKKAMKKAMKKAPKKVSKKAKRR
jgi:hypothetical protein